MEYLTPQELFNHSVNFKLIRDYNNYAIYITQAANYGYREAINTIYKDTFSINNQNYSVTLPFYLKTAQKLLFKTNIFY